MAKEKFLSASEVKLNIKKVQDFLVKQNLSAIYLSSSDIFLNEYVPLEECHRYYVTNFTGSTAEVVVPAKGKVQLFVDGRYFEQADKECDLSLIEVQKVPYGLGIQDAMITWLKTNSIKKLAIEADRADLFLVKKLESNVGIKLFFNSELSKVIAFQKPLGSSHIDELDFSLVGETTADKLKRIVKPGEAVFISQLDSIAWLTNARRYELPYQSTFRAKALATSERVYLLMETLSNEFKNESVEVFMGDFSKLEEFFNIVKFYEMNVKPLMGEKPYDFKKVEYADRSTNASDYEKLKNFFGEEKLINVSIGLNPFHAQKNAVEIQSMESSFNRGDEAIFNIIKWTKEQVSSDKELSELGFYHKCNEFYKNIGAKSQSFNTIAAVGSNSSIIHFGSPSDEVSLTKNQFVLLDSGGYFESGYATDTTRAFISGGEATDKQKEIYTLVLKALLQGLNAVFPEGTWGSVIDGVIRQPLFKHGQNYAHGTGHGVGINVHEAGFRLSTASNIPVKEGTVGSIEPGIYIPGFGGVRLENVVVVEKHPKLANMLCFRSLVYVGFDHDLIDYELLSEEERDWLDQYEKECQKRNRSFVYKN